MDAISSHIVLVVDPEPESMHETTRQLEQIGCAVLTAQDRPRAIEVAKASRPGFVLLGVKRPAAGYQLCARLSESQDLKYVPIVFIPRKGSAYDFAAWFRREGPPVPPKDAAPRNGNGTSGNGHAAPKNGSATHHRSAESVPAPGRTRAGRTTVFRRKSGCLNPSDFHAFTQQLAADLHARLDQVETLSKLASRDVYSACQVLGIAPSELARRIAEFLELPHVPDLPERYARLGKVPIDFCRHNHVVPVLGSDGQPGFAIANPFDLDLVGSLMPWVDPDQPPVFWISDPARIDQVLAPNAAQAREPADLSGLLGELRALYPANADPSRMRLQALERAEPLVRLVNHLIERGYRVGASDIHLEPADDAAIVRYRIDGDLHVAHRLTPASLIRPIVARIKVMAKLDITEHRMPQDGRIDGKDVIAGNADFDLRVATSPTGGGEKVVLRILDKGKSVLPLVELGLSEKNLEVYRAKIRSPWGMILHVGPTGSGKSMTLYAALNELRSPHVNIQTIEDPVEYTLGGINQMQVHAEIGLTFSQALRSVLRQDPNIILVGEMRDRESAQIAAEASLTGHLLFSTLHTNDAPSTITRLVEMGIEPYLISSSLMVVCAQRLLRRLCKECREPYRPSEEERRLIHAGADEDLVLHRAKGCEKCNGIGYRGRIGTHELLVMDSVLRKAINEKGATAEGIRRIAIENGMIPLFRDAIEKVRAGICSVEDVKAKVFNDEASPTAAAAGCPRSGPVAVEEAQVPATD